MNISETLRVLDEVSNEFKILPEEIQIKIGLACQLVTDSQHYFERYKKLAPDTNGNIDPDLLAYIRVGMTELHDELDTFIGLESIKYYRSNDVFNKFYKTQQKLRYKVDKAVRQLNMNPPIFNWTKLK